jgi:hypothetical protein
MDTTEQDKAIEKLQKVIRIIHVVFLLTLPVSVLFIVLLPVIGINYIYAKNDPILYMIEILFAVFSILFLAVGLYFPLIIRKFKTANSIYRELLFGHVIRIALFESIVCYCIILGIMGSRWFVIAPLFLLTCLALFFTFPTDKRLDKWRSVNTS